jgi:hypothetical protein
LARGCRYFVALLIEDRQGCVWILQERHIPVRLSIYVLIERAELLELDEMEQGFPRMTLQHLYDVVRLCADRVAREDLDNSVRSVRTAEFRSNAEVVKRLINAENGLTNVFSWRKVQGNLARLLRLGIFDNPGSAWPDYQHMTDPGSGNDRGS